MCGITGIIDYQKQAYNKETLKAHVSKMSEAIVHRGPDGEGVYFSEHFGAAMRRLAIIDLEGGDQPLFNEKGDIGVFFNGEIYNFQELRKDLQQKGHVFKTKADTEVLVHLYEEYGDNMPSYLRGMFAFIIFDTNREQYFLARDQFGEKPLYYWNSGSTLVFSSELKSLLACDQVPRKLNSEALVNYLQYSIVPDPVTMFSGISTLPPGYSMRVDANGVKKASYFVPNGSCENIQIIKNEEEAVEYIKPLLNQAIKRQMISDVPLGAFLSGGIDSSTVVALMQQNASKPIDTFTVKFDHQLYDESRVARKVAEHLGTNHHEVIIPNATFTQDIFWKIVDHVGVPFADSSSIPTYFITQEIRKHVKVALSGDGGDELFGGYPVFQWFQQITAIKNKIPQPARYATTKVLGAMQATWPFNKVSKVRQLNKALNLSLKHEAEIPMGIQEMMPMELVKRLLYSKNGVNASKLLTDFYNPSEQMTSLRRIMQFRLKYDLPADMLIKVDRMSMANSLEVRAPFLDEDLFQGSLALDDSLLIKEGKGKHLVRKIMQHDLPDIVFDHPKMGFAIPLHTYENEAYHDLCEQLFTSANPMSEYVDLKVVQEIKRSALSTTSDNAKVSVYQASHRLWNLLLLFGWAQRFKIEL